MDPGKFLGNAFTIGLSKDIMPYIVNPITCSLVEKFHRMQIYIRNIPFLEKYPNNILMELFPAKLGRNLLADFIPADKALKEDEVEPLAKLATLLGKDCEKVGKTIDFICPATEFAVEKKEDNNRGIR